MPAAGQAVGEKARALGGVFDPGAREGAERNQVTERLEAARAKAAISGRSAEAPDR